MTGSGTAARWVIRVTGRAARGTGNDSAKPAAGGVRAATARTRGSWAADFRV